MDVILGFVFLVVGVFFYFVPTYYAKRRGHPSHSAIFILNLFLGWTLIGWVGALVWSFSGKPDGIPSPETHVKCPDCAELVLKQAKVCKHCGCRLVPQ